LDDGAATVGRKVVAVDVALDGGRLFLSNWQALENIIARILHGLSPRIEHESDSKRPLLGK
jgi:hypothetical protein